MDRLTTAGTMGLYGFQHKYSQARVRSRLKNNIGLIKYLPPKLRMRTMMNRDGMLETIHQWDVNTFQRIISSRLHGVLVTTARQVSRTGDGWAYPLVPVILYLLGFPEVENFFYFAGTAFAIERTIYPVAKKSFKRRRPYNIVPDYTSHIIASDEFSFPSGHTSAAFLMATAVVLCYGPGFALLYVWAASVGASRVILGVHFPTDILVGAALGSGIAATIYCLTTVL